MTKPNRQVRISRLEEQGEETDLDATTPAERIGMMWQLALDAWAFMGEPVAAESRLPRHIVRVLRREG
jgi:hypothetical protein